jgi:predicted Zn-dependent peptidase
VLTRRLEDGTAVWLDPMRDVRSVTLGVTVAAGSADEESRRLGSTHFLEHLLFKRSRRRSGAAIARLTDRLGGDCDAYTTKESVTFHARTTAERAGDALDLLLDLTDAPAFTAEDVEVERDVILEEMADAKDVPEDDLHDTFVRELWPDHPLGAPILGTRESVRRLTRAALVERFRAIFRPERTLIAAAGAFDSESLLARIRKARRRRVRVGGSDARSPARPGRPRARRCAIHVPRPGLTQTHLLIGAATMRQTDPLVPAALLASEILGGGVSSRLWRDVRERRGLAYQVGTGLTLHREAGVAVIEAATHPRNLPALVRTTGRILARVLGSGVTRAELARAKNQFHVEAALALESTAARRHAAARAWLYRGRPYEVEEYLADIDRVRPDDVSEALHRLYTASGPPGLGVSGPAPKGVSMEDLAGELGVAA